MWRYRKVRGSCLKRHHLGGHSSNPPECSLYGMEGKIRRVADGDINNDFNTVAHSKVRHPRFPCAKPRSSRTVTGHKVEN